MKISDLRHVVTLCSQQDVVTEGGDLRLAREGVWTAWAGIKPKKGSTFSVNGATYGESRDSGTHIITMRYRADLNISTMAWIYEKRAKSSPRWFKIISVHETETEGTEMFTFSVRIVERGDEAIQPGDASRRGPVTGLPDGVKL